MAEFVKAFDITMGHEGAYVNDPEDPGGETYRGISRHYWPQWTGWLIIDSYVRGAIPGAGRNHELDAAVKEFYREHFWTPFQGDYCDSQDIANEVFDTGVNMGLTRGIEFLQEALNLCNRNGVYWKDISVDGQWGIETTKTLKVATNRRQADFVFKLQNILQGEFYINKMRHNPAKERWIGWFNRVNIEKKGI